MEFQTAYAYQFTETNEENLYPSHRHDHGRSLQGTEHPHLADETATNGPSMIFSLNGVRQQGSLDTLSRGIYIVKQDDKVRKVIIAIHQM